MPELIRETSDLNIDVLLGHVKELQGLSSQIGWFESARYDEKTPVAMVAAQNEFGNVEQNIPPRPFMRTTIAEHQTQWQQQLASGARAIAAGNETAATVMEKMSAQAAGQMREKISEIQSPTLSEVTIRNRLKSLSKAHGKTEIQGYQEANHTITKPLVFTGILLNTITYIVNDGDEIKPWEGLAVDEHNVYGDRT